MVLLLFVCCSLSGSRRRYFRQSGRPLALPPPEQVLVDLADRHPGPVVDELDEAGRLETWPGASPPGGDLVLGDSDPLVE
jgi:hypothetical protein